MTFSQAPSTPHHFLAQLIGSWVGRTRTWLEPDSAPVESQIQGNIQLVLDGRFALYLYQSSVDGELQHGIFTFGYNTNLNRYEASWVDSYHNNTAIMFCTGEATEKGFAVSGSIPDANGGPDWGWRTEIELADSDHLAITAYNISPEGGETKVMESLLIRMKK